MVRKASATPPTSWLTMTVLPDQLSQPENTTLPGAAARTSNVFQSLGRRKSMAWCQLPGGALYSQVPQWTTWGSLNGRLNGWPANVRAETRAYWLPSTGQRY